MEKINNICWIFVFMLLSFILGYVSGGYNKNEIEDDLIDTSYNYIVLDSIKYNLISRDSIVYKLKVKYKDDVKKAQNLSDSDAVKLFKQLVTD